MLRPVVDLAQDQVHSVASLSIGQGNVFRGQENKEMFSPRLSNSFQHHQMCLLSRKDGRAKGWQG